MKSTINFKLVFYRAMMSQSAVSLTMTRIAALLNDNDVKYNLVFLESDDIAVMDKIGLETSVIIAKPNFKDYGTLLPILKGIKEGNASTLVFLCGPYISLNYAGFISQEPWLDGILVGFPEECAINLAKALRDDKDIDNIPNLVTPKNIVNFKPEKNLLSFEKLPLPIRTIEEFEVGAYANIEASRGCDNFCSYCHVPLYSRQGDIKRRELRSNQSIIEEMVLLKKIGKTFHIFNDSHFWANDDDNNRIIDFCDRLIEKKLNIRFYIYLKSFPFPNDQVLKKLKEAGLARVFIGVENASSENQRLYSKMVNLDQFASVRSRCEDIGINVHIGFMLFNPYLKFDQIRPNLDYLNRINKIFRLGVITEPARVIPGSRLESSLRKDGLLFAAENYNTTYFEYKFIDPKTELVFINIRRIFIGQIYPDRYNFEYFSITGRLMRDLAESLAPGVSKEFDKEYMNYLKIQKKGSALVYKFLVEMLSAIDSDGKINDAKEAEFTHNFKKACVELEYAWTILKKEILKTKAATAVEEVYLGRERIN